jgi:hypothetical protein
MNQKGALVHSEVCRSLQSRHGGRVYERSAEAVTLKELSSVVLEEVPSLHSQVPVKAALPATGL